MEYKSELIDFEKEDAESKKRMLGSDKVNIEEIKEARDEFIKVNAYILELANNQFSGLSLQARMKHEKFMQGFDSLLSIIEQAEKAFNDIADSKYLTIEAARKISDLALQAIRK